MTEPTAKFEDHAEAFQAMESLVAIAVDLHQAIDLFGLEQSIWTAFDSELGYLTERLQTMPGGELVQPREQLRKAIQMRDRMIKFVSRSRVFVRDVQRLVGCDVSQVAGERLNKNRSS